MIARIQQISTLALLITLVSGIAFFWLQGSLIFGLAIPGLVLLGYAIFLAVEFSLSAWLGGGLGADAAGLPRPCCLELVRAWFGEFWRAPVVFCWQQPFRSGKEPDLLIGGANGHRGIVLVHGFVCNRGFWNSWMKVLRHRRIPFVAVNLEPSFGSITMYPRIIDSAARSIEAATGKLPVLVAHSMGGLAVRAWLADCRTARAHRVITIGTPHRGTWLARFGRTMNLVEMRPSSDWMMALERNERGVDGSFFTCFYSNCDNIVFPTLSATLPGADNRHLSATAHVQMAQHPGVMSEVLKWVVPVPEPVDAEPGQFGAVGSRDGQLRR